METKPIPQPTEELMAFLKVDHDKILSMVNEIAKNYYGLDGLEKLAFTDGYRSGFFNALRIVRWLFRDKIENFLQGDNETELLFLKKIYELVMGIKKDDTIDKENVTQ